MKQISTFGEKWVCTAKIRKELYHALEQIIRENPSYGTPEIVVTQVVASQPAHQAEA